MTDLALACIRKVELPLVLQGLGRAIQDQISSTLSNDESSSDDEILEFWTTECGIPVDVAQAALRYRNDYFMDPFYELFGSLLSRTD